MWIDVRPTAEQALWSGSRSLLVALLAPLSLAQEPDLDDLLTKAARYVERYERELGGLIADERYAQESGPDPNSSYSGTRRGPPPQPERRKLFSEFVLLQLPGTPARWAGFRNVLEVNGRGVRDRERRFDSLRFQKHPDDAVEYWRALNEESSRFNIGPITRTVNLPTLALTVLRPDSQVQFTFRIRDAHERVDREDAVVLDYEELDPPTLVSDPQGQSVYTSGRLWLTSEDGRPIRTEFVIRPMRHGLPLARITVRYGRDPRLNAWIPTQMEEEYFVARVRVRCVATYSNYRRFETSGRIVP